MDAIVVHCTAQHRQFRIDREREARVRRAQRALDVAARRAAREDEAEIARALGQRHQQLVRLRGDPHVVDAVDARARPRRRRRRGSTPRRGIGIIITPDARASRDQPSDDSPSACRSSSSSSEMRRVAGRRPLRLEPQRARAQAADRPRGHFEDEHAAASLTRHSAWIGPCRRPSARGRARDGVDDARRCTAVGRGDGVT